MVKYQDAKLDQVFTALADPTRRGILAQLHRQDGLSISELAHPFAMTLPAVLKHLDVLTDAGLVTRSKNGRTVTCRLKAQPMARAHEWLERYADYWSESLDRLTDYVEKKKP